MPPLLPSAKEKKRKEKRGKKSLGELLEILTKTKSKGREKRGKKIIWTVSRSQERMRG